MIERILIDVDGTVGDFHQVLQHTLVERGSLIQLPRYILEHDSISLTEDQWKEGEVREAIRDVQFKHTMHMTHYEDAPLVLRTLSFDGRLDFVSNRPTGSPIRKWLIMTLGPHVDFAVHLLSPEERVVFMVEAGKDILIDDRMETHRLLPSHMIGLVPARDWNSRVERPRNVTRFAHWRQVPGILLQLKAEELTYEGG